MSDQIPIKEQFINFASWIMNFVLAIDQWESDNEKEYTTNDPAVELNLLAGMFQAGMTPQEAAGTYTTTNTRILVDQQLNVLICASFLQWAGMTGGEILGMIGKEPGDKHAMVGGPQNSPLGFLKIAAETVTYMSEELMKRKKQKPNPDNPDGDLPDDAA